MTDAGIRNLLLMKYFNKEGKVVSAKLTSHPPLIL